MTDKERDRIECAIRHIQTAVDVDSWAAEIAVEAMRKLFGNSEQLEASYKKDHVADPGKMVGDLISRAKAIETVRKAKSIGQAHRMLMQLPSAQPDYQEVLGWLLAYHTKSFDLHGRYLPHEVISWLINDFTKEFIADRNEEE